MKSYQYFGELGYLINCILPCIHNLNNETIIHTFKDYEFILKQFCNAKFITYDFISTQNRICQHNSLNQLHLENLNIISDTKFLNKPLLFKNIIQPITTKEIDMNKKSILMNFRSRKTDYGNFNKEFYENIVSYFSFDYTIYCCGNKQETYDISSTQFIEFENIPYIANNCVGCILPDSGLTSMIIKCKPQKAIVLLNTSQHTLNFQHELIYKKNFENFNSPYKIIYIENNKLDDDTLLNFKEFIEFDFNFELSEIL